jgi:RND family efflux transporter MFP subunit
MNHFQIRFVKLNPIIASLTLASLLLTLNLACKKGPGSDQGTAVSVHVHKAVLLTMPERVSYPGTVEGDKRITLSTKLMGQIISLPYQEGTPVRAGQVLGKIRSGDLTAKRVQIEANRDEAAAALTNIKTNYDRIHDLFQRKSATQKELDDVTMAYTMAQAKMKAIDGMESEVGDILRYADIISPVDGSIVARYAEEGNMANPGMPLLVVEDTRKLKIAISVPESEIHLFRLNSPVDIQVDALGPKVLLKGVVEEINAAGNAGSHQFQVKVRLEQSQSTAVRSGMYATVFINGEVRSTVSIPDSLLIRQGDLTGAFLVTQDNEALLRWLRTGKTLPNGDVEILSGLTAGELVIADRSDNITDGMSVRVAQ